MTLRKVALGGSIYVVRLLGLTRIAASHAVAISALLNSAHGGPELLLDSLDSPNA